MTDDTNGVASGPPDPAPRPLTPEQAEAQRRAMSNEAVRLMTWWRCSGCIGVIAMIAIGSMLGIWLTLRSDVFGNDPWVTDETCWPDVEIPAAEANALVQRAALGTFRGTPLELTTLANHWLEQSPLVGEGSRCCVTMVEPGLLHVQGSLRVPTNLSFPGSLMQGAFYNVSLTFGGTYDPAELELLDLRLYKVGERPEAPIHTVDDVHKLGESFQYFLKHHPELQRALQQVRKITVNPEHCEVTLQTQ